MTHWKLALIELVHPGADGVVRVVTIRTNEGTFKSPIQQIAALPKVMRRQRQVKVVSLTTVHVERYVRNVR